MDTENLVPEDMIRLRLGYIIAADVKLADSYYISLDQSVLTGESLPVDRKDGEPGYSGSVVKRVKIPHGIRRDVLVSLWNWMDADKPYFLDNRHNGIVLLLLWIFGKSERGKRVQPEDAALEILEKRYARGEITKTQFDDMKKEISAK